MGEWTESYKQNGWVQVFEWVATLRLHKDVFPLLNDGATFDCSLETNPARPFLDNLDIPGSPSIPMLMPNIARTPDQHR